MATALVGATPVFADIDSETLTVTAETAEAAVNSASVIVNGNVACAKELKGKIAKIATTIWAKVLVRKNFTMLLDIIFKLFLKKFGTKVTIILMESGILTQKKR